MRRLYINGEDYTEVGTIRTEFNISNNMNIGQLVGGGDNFADSMDDLRIYDGLLTQVQVGALGGVVQAAGDKYTGLDQFGRVVDQKWVDANNGNAVVDEFVYVYDISGNVLDKFNLTDSDFDEYDTYDALNQLITSKRALTGVNDQSWNLDSLGNMNSVTTNGVTSNETHNSANQLTAIGTSSLSFDNNGNTTVDDAGHHLVYDAWNHLVAVYNDNGSGGTGTLIVAYAYDGLGRRITETPAGSNPTELYYTSNWQVVEERISAGGSMTLSATYVWSPVYVDAMVERDYAFNAGTFSKNERVFVLQDANYNSTALVLFHGISGDGNLDGVVDIGDDVLIANHWGQTGPGGDAIGDLNHDGTVDFIDYGVAATNWNATGSAYWSVVERLVYTPYGDSTTYTVNYTVKGDWLAWNYRSQGGREDLTLGMVEHEERIFKISMMRWLTADPILYRGGTLDLYEFVGDNPINRVDPSGEMSLVDAEDGKTAEKRIFARYREFHPTAITNSPLSLVFSGMKIPDSKIMNGAARFVLGLRPDIFDPPTRALYEIKKFNTLGVALGLKTLVKYWSWLHLGGVGAKLGPSNDPAVWGIANIGGRGNRWLVWFSMFPGLINYSIENCKPKKIPRLALQSAPMPALNPNLVPLLIYNPLGAVDDNPNHIYRPIPGLDYEPGNGGAVPYPGIPGSQGVPVGFGVPEGVPELVPG